MNMLYRYPHHPVLAATLLMIAAGDISAADLSYAIVDTGQSSCYDPDTGLVQSCNGAGHDADYSGNTPDYSVSADGTRVTDNITGLTWTQSTDTNGDEVVDSSDKLTQTQALSYCAGLSLGGLEWRLPTIKEAYSLILFSGEDASGYQGSDTSVPKLFLDERFDRALGDLNNGERIIDAQYATATQYAATVMNGNAAMFGMNFVDGRVKGYPLSNAFYVRCVSGNSSYGVNVFVDNHDGTISDQASGLMWQQDDSASTDWSDAVSQCEAATTAGYENWRLPNVKELHSLVDYSRAPAASAAVDPLFNSTLISNEAGQSDWAYYWSSTTHVNFLGRGDSAAYIAFGRAVGYFEASPSAGQQLLDVHGAGAQRANGKQSFAAQMDAQSANVGFGTFYYNGPQGDILRLDNRLRCVRDIDTEGLILLDGFEG